MNELSYVVVIPSSGRSKSLLLRAILSSTRQTPKPYLVLVADDSSQQDLNQYQELLPNAVKFLQTGGAVGGGRARNIACDYVTDHCSAVDWLFFLDDDDAWSPVKMNHVNGLIRKRPEAALIGTGYTTKLSRLDVTEQAKIRVRDVSDRLIYDNAGISPSSMGVKVELFKEVQGFDETLSAWQGRNFFARLVLKGAVALKIENRFTYQDQGHGLERISDLQEPRYDAMLQSIARTGYSKHQAQYARVMIARAKQRDAGRGTLIPTLFYWRRAIAAGPTAVRHFFKLVLLDCYRKAT